MSTNPNLRGSGLGSQILAAIMRWFDERDVDFVDLNASEAAQQFYERANFEVAEYSGMRSYFRDAKTRKWIAENLGR